MNEYTPFLRAGRTTADRCSIRDLPTGTDSINISAALTGTKVDIQTADAAAVASQDLTDTSITAPVRTLSGQQDVSLQLFEQSPVSFDEIVFSDLLSDYNRRLDMQVIAGTGLSGQLKGITAISGTNAITYTDASPTVPLLYPSVMKGASLVSQGVFQAPHAIVMHPRRWWWIASALDGQNRPLVTPEGTTSVTVVAGNDPSSAEGHVGSIAGVNVYVDSNLPINGGAGTNQDSIIVGRFSTAFRCGKARCARGR